jgi:hypothetical protein
MITVETKGRDPNITRTFEIIGIYRHPKDNLRFLEKLVDRTGCMGKTTKLSIIGGFLTLPYADWNGHAENSKGIQIF